MSVRRGSAAVYCIVFIVVGLLSKVRAAVRDARVEQDRGRHAIVALGCVAWRFDSVRVDLVKLGDGRIGEYAQVLL